MNRFVAFSGGVDSTSLALLETDAQLIFTDTGWEFPEIYSHLDKFEKTTGRKVVRLKNSKEETLPDRIRRHKFLPGHGARYCTQEFKIEVYNNFIKNKLPAEMLIGLRLDEPLREGNLTDIPDLTIRYPLRERKMTRLDCVRLCLESDLLPRYPPYMARGGCKGCFYKRKSEVYAMIDLQPKVMDELQALEEEIQDERGKFAIMFPNTGKSIRQMRLEASLQTSMFSLEEVYQDAADNSDKGVECGLFCHK